MLVEKECSYPAGCACFVLVYQRGLADLSSSNVLPFRGLDKCVQMTVVGKQQLYNGLCSGSLWFTEQWEASGAAKALRAAFQSECCWKGN